MIFPTLIVWLTSLATTGFASGHFVLGDVDNSIHQSKDEVFYDATVLGMLHSTSVNESWYPYLNEDKGTYGYDFHGSDWPGVCKSGIRQSPVLLDSYWAQQISGDEFQPLIFINYDMVKVNITVDNHGLLLEPKIEVPNLQVGIAAGKLNKGFYRFTAAHFHWPAEHMFRNVKQRHALELHLVHILNDTYKTVDQAVNSGNPNAIAVLAVMFELGYQNAEIEKIETMYERRMESGVSVTVRLHDLLPSNTEHFFRYHGSLTTPPCSEVVVWTVFMHSSQISKQQADWFPTIIRNKNGKPIDSTYRRLQPTGSRTIYAIRKNSANAATEINLLGLLVITAYSSIF